MSESSASDLSRRLTVVLASASPRRRELITMTGLWARIHPAHIDESVFCSSDPSADAVAAARAKALEVARTEDTGDLVIGADTVVIVNGQALGKPASRQEARAFLERLSGREHQVATGLAVTKSADGVCETSLELTKVFFRPLLPQEIESYLDTDEPYDKAGAYGIQGRGGDFVERLEGDYYNVVGLPLNALVCLLAKFTDVSALSIPPQPRPWASPPC